MSEDERTALRIAYCATSAAYCSVVAKDIAAKRESLPPEETVKRGLYEIVERRAREVSQFMLKTACELLMPLPHETRLKLIAAAKASRGGVSM